LPEGTLVKVLDGEGQWRLVKLWGASRAATDIAGWVHGRYLEKVADGDVAETSVERAALDLERRLVPEPGLYRCVGIDRFEEVPVNPEELSEARPLLLLLPGLASNAQGTFGEIWQPSNSAFLRYLRARFEEDILAFNYWSLSRHPIENTLDLVERLPAGSRLMIVGHSVGGLIGELICRTARVDAKEPFTEEEISWFSNTAQRQHSLIRLSEELQHKRLRVERFIAVATPFRGHSLFHKSKKLLAVLPSLAKVLNVGGRLLSTPEFEALLRALGHPEELPGLEAMLPESPFLHLINSPKTEVDCELSVITGDTEADGILAKLGNIAMDKVLGEENDLVVPTASMVGGAHRTGLARLAAFKGPEINHFNYFADRRVLDGIRQALDSPDAGGIWRPLRTAGSPQSR
jgi:pimeloyl-ACP methyl ester carboxylesterase